MTVTISADDPRTIRALELAAEADQWLKGRNRDGEEVFGVPSQSDPGHYYIVTRSSCDCPDFRHNSGSGSGGEAAEARACKHVLAVRLHTELVKAQQQQQQVRPSSRGRRDHLSVVPRPESGS